ncbi:MAG: 23S rRNA (guanosine(2251)-2'-O)-methyltransferase RlmB [Luminiphilus sp.]|jgi:23S rRNA (guanosine2251-2'-O)-methyltransferase|nr:23S rRNA (guanosine(2251)-2'-O)-methyltransferase RlmB [Luminiphilus sp.]MDG2036948.1 23S rRNA (guanosine(2251)-2'-O)-methyltransferase RlmB [Luminiphilus sp.]|tara:strand:- start:2329 stop:3078 length:750 start_codon:yes stop_codon:yes gene_type:complete
MTNTVFGYHAVESLIRREPSRVATLQVQGDRRDKRMQAMCELARNQGVVVVSCAKSDLDTRVGGRHQGVVAVLHAGVQHEAAGMISEADLMERVADAPSPLLLILDGVTDPHNLGACLRSADAAGVTAVIFPKDKSADVTDVVRKVASGAAEAVPWARVTNLARTIDALKQAGVWIIGTDGDAAETVYERDLTVPCAVILGSEGAGMRRLTRDLCDFTAKLPMAGSVSSLNVSVAAGICLFEALRQRGA